MLDFVCCEFDPRIEKMLLFRMAGMSGGTDAGIVNFAREADIPCARARQRG
jgi:hypothetical protein